MHGELKWTSSNCKFNVWSKDVEAEAKAGSGGSGRTKILPLPLPYRLFDLKSNLAKKFCLFPNVD